MEDLQKHPMALVLSMAEKSLPFFFGKHFTTTSPLKRYLGSARWRNEVSAGRRARQCRAGYVNEAQAQDECGGRKETHWHLAEDPRHH
jgi:hypothetical protein